jgi:hypothetical protein
MTSAPRGEQVAERVDVEVRRLEAARPQSGVSVAVVELARLRVGERLVGLRRLAEARLGVGVLRDVRMQLAGQLAEGLLDLLLACGARHAEHLVVVAFRGRHRVSIVPAGVALARSGYWSA